MELSSERDGIIHAAGADCVSRDVCKGGLDTTALPHLDHPHLLAARIGRLFASLNAGLMESIKTYQILMSLMMEYIISHASCPDIPPS
ncbi:hypothetical protein LJR251_005092 [Rhizobium rhizogenes]|jgi:hypothetical protein|uniref:hypothetical protein n=1 Tax=Rhizobium rhizogenes TaxID=359 RepID=UPI003ECE9DCD